MSEHEVAAATDAMMEGHEVVDLTAAGQPPVPGPGGLINMSDWYDTQFARALPELVPVVGTSGGLFYAGKSNSLAAPPGRGKTMLAQLHCQQEAAAGRATVFLDFEKDLPTFQVRLKALGLQKQDAELTWYWRPDCSIAALMPTLLAHCSIHAVSTVVIDSVGGALERMGPHANENDNGCVRAWYRSSVDPLVSNGVAVILVDHLKRADSESGSDGRYAKGAAAKLEVITGAAWTMRSQQPFSVDEAGVVQLSCSKDNNGTWPEGAKVTCHVTPADSGRRVVLDLRAGGAALPPPRPVAAIERVLHVLRSATEPMSRSALRTATGLKDEQLKQALDVLISEKVVQEQPGPRGARLTSLVPTNDDQQALPFDVQ